MITRNKEQKNAAVFDVYQRPKGKRRFVNRRQVGRVSRPLLAERHLPILSFGRGKRCFCSDGTTLYNTKIEDKIELVYEPVLKFYLYSDDLISKPEMAPKVETKNEDLNLRKSFKIATEPYSHRSNLKREWETLLEVKNPTTEYNQSFAFEKDGKREEFGIIIKEAQETSLIIGFVEEEKAKSKFESKAEDLVKKHWGEFKGNLKGIKKSKDDFMTIIDDSAKEVNFISLKRISNELTTELNEIEIHDVTYAVEPDEVYFLKSLNFIKKIKFQPAFLALKHKPQLVGRSGKICMENLVKNELTLEVESDLTKPLKKGKFSWIRSLSSEAFGPNIEAGLHKKSLELEETILDFSLTTNKIKILEVANKEVGKKATNEKKKAEFKSYLISSDKKLTFGKTNLVCGKTRFCTKETMFKNTLTPIKIQALGLSKTKIKRKYKVKIKGYENKTVGFVQSTLDNFEAETLTERIAKHFFRTKRHAKYCMKLLKSVKAGKIEEKIFENKFNWHQNSKTKVLTLKNSYAHRFSRQTTPISYKDFKVRFRALIRKHRIEGIKVGEAVKAIKKIFGFTMYGPDKAVERPMVTNNKIEFGIWLFGEIKFRRIRRIRFIKRPLNLLSKKTIKVRDLKPLTRHNYMGIDGGFKKLDTCAKSVHKKPNEFNFKHLMKIILPSGLIGPVLKIKPLKLDRDRDFITPDYYEKIIKGHSFKVKILPFAFGFPEFYKLPVKYKHMDKTTFLHINEKPQQEKFIKGNFNISKKRVYRNSYSLKDPRLFVFEDQGVRSSSSDYFRTKGLSIGATIKLETAKKFKQVWQKTGYLKTVEMKPLFISEGPKVITRDVKASLPELKSSNFAAKKAELPQIKEAFKSAFKQKIEIKENIVKGLNSAYEEVGKDIRFNEILATLFKTLEKSSNFRFSEFEQKVSLNKNYYLPISESNQVKGRKAKINKAAYRSLRLPYKPAFGFNEKSWKATSALETMEVEDGQDSQFPLIKNKEVRNLGIHGIKKESFGKRSYNELERVEKSAPRRFLISEGGLGVEYIRKKPHVTTLNCGERDNLAFKVSSFVNVFKRFEKSWRFLAIGQEYLYAYLPTVGDFENLDKDDRYVGKDEGFRDNKEKLEILELVNFDNINILEDSNWICQLNWDELDDKLEEKLEVSHFESAFEDGAGKMKMLGKEVSSFDKIKEFKLIELPKTAAEAEIFAERKTVEIASLKPNFMPREIKLEGAGLVSQRTAYKSLEQPEVVKDFEVNTRVQFEEMKYRGLNYIKRQKFENDVRYGWPQVLFRPAFIPEWLDLFAKKSKETLKIKEEILEK